MPVSVTEFTSALPIPSILIFLLLLFFQPAKLFAATSEEAGFVGSQNCKGCHSEEYDNWQNSHHDLAMQLPTPDSVLGDFNNAEFIYNGITSRYYRDGDKFMVQSDGEDGKLQDFEVAYVFGVYPLQQYLLPLSRGRLQAHTIAWDTRPETQGGQRWFHLYPDDKVDHEDALHWTGSFMNWNTSCAECHSTDIHKNYSAVTRSFDTQYAEIDVGCEACHGPGETHIELAQENSLTDVKNSGFALDLAQRGNWMLDEGTHIARRAESLASDTQIDNCARCHSRRGTLGDYHYGADLLDTHRLSMLQTPVYHVDGQIQDEVYVYGSFVQSKMHQAGVVCSHCHEPHNLELRAPGNAICAQCHVSSQYDTPEHHHHETDSSGAECANCHMPETTYMKVDPRRDHSMRIPRPDLSRVLDTPNACNQCHVDRNAQWAFDSLRNWGVTFNDTATHPARAIASFEQGDERFVTTLAAIANDENAAPIWRASVMELLGRTGSREALQTATSILHDTDPMVRASTVRSLEFLPLQQRYPLLMPLLEDEITTVRMEVAMALSGVPLGQVPAEQASKLQSLFDEFLTIQAQSADVPAIQMQIGSFQANRGDFLAAENAYNEALAINPQLLPAYLNLADLLRVQERDDEAHELMLKALDVEPEHGPTLHAIGLLETRRGNSSASLDYLERAAAVETTGTRYRFVYAVALHDLGKPRQAIVQLEELLQSASDNEDTLMALSNYHRELGQRKEAANYALELTRIAPGNTAYQQLYQHLSAPER